MNGEEPGRLRVCPDPDRVCLQGGCSYCRDSPRSWKLVQLRDYARERGWREDLDYGLRGNLAAGRRSGGRTS